MQIETLANYIEKKRTLAFGSYMTVPLSFIWQSMAANHQLRIYANGTATLCLYGHGNENVVHGHMRLQFASSNGGNGCAVTTMFLYFKLYVAH